MSQDRYISGEQHGGTNSEIGKRHPKEKFVNFSVNPTGYRVRAFSYKLQQMQEPAAVWTIISLEDNFSTWPMTWPMC